MRITHDQDADAVYVYLTNEPVTDTQIVDDCRFVHYGPSGTVRGIEFLYVSQGVMISDLPTDIQALATVLLANNIPVADVLVVWSAADIRLGLARTVASALYPPVRVTPMIAVLSVTTLSCSAWQQDAPTLVPLTRTNIDLPTAEAARHSMIPA
jgi:uncharacterized protein YuzE